MHLFFLNMTLPLTEKYLKKKKYWFNHQPPSLIYNTEDNQQTIEILNKCTRQLNELHLHTKLSLVSNLTSDVVEGVYSDESEPQTVEVPDEWDAKSNNTYTHSPSSFNKIILPVKNCTVLHDVGLILSQNGWRGGLDIRLLSTVTARVCLYVRGDRGSSQRGSTCYHHYLKWPAVGFWVCHAAQKQSVNICFHFPPEPLCHQGLKMTLSSSPRTTFERSNAERCRTADRFGPRGDRIELRASFLQLRAADTLRVVSAYMRRGGVRGHRAYAITFLFSVLMDFGIYGKKVSIITTASTKSVTWILVFHVNVNMLIPPAVNGIHHGALEYNIQPLCCLTVRKHGHH